MLAGPIFLVSFRSTRFLQFYYKTIIQVKLTNLQARLFKNNFYHQKVHKKPHVRHYHTLVFQAVWEKVLIWRNYVVLYYLSNDTSGFCQK